MIMWPLGSLYVVQRGALEPLSLYGGLSKLCEEAIGEQISSFLSGRMYLIELEAAGTAPVGSLVYLPCGIAI